MRLRPCRAADLDALAEIDRACFAPGIAYTREELAAFVRRRGARTWVAGEGEEVAGFLVAQPESRETLHIVTLDVVAAWRRQGVGSLLMEAAEQWAAKRGLRTVTLETAEDNLPAHQFYLARGYLPRDRVKHYYADGTDAWVMVKPLTPPGSL